MIRVNNRSLNPSGNSNNVSQQLATLFVFNKPADSPGFMTSLAIRLPSADCHNELYLIHPPQIVFHLKH